MKIMAGAPASGSPGDVRKNEAEAGRLIDRAKAAGADLLILPELCLTGASCGDLLRYELLTRSAGQAALRLAERCDNLCCVFGLPLRAEGRIYSVMLAVKDGKPAGCWIRDLFSSYVPRAISLRERALDIRLEGVSIQDWSGKALPLMGGESLALSFADVRDMAKEAARLYQGGATIAAFTASRPALAGSADIARAQAIEAASSGGLCALVSGGYNESSTDWVADGMALIASPDGQVSEAAPFSFETALYPDQARPFTPEAEQALDPAVPYAPPEGPARERWCRDAVTIAAHALRLRMERVGAKKAVLGLSGGLDSAMALIIACRAFELMGLDAKSGILPYSLPGFGSGSQTRGNSAALARALGIGLGEIDITGNVSRHFEDIGHDGRHDAAFENAQARERTQVLMDLANMHGGLMVGTGDLSELALGFTTYGGDHLSMYCVNGGLYKSAIRLILRQTALDSESLPLKDALSRVLDTPISPELLPGQAGEIAQKTEDIVGPYELNDFYLHHFLLERRDPEALFNLARGAFGDKYSPTELLARMKSLFSRFFAAQFKRSCLSDGPQILDVSIAPRGGLELPSDASCALWMDETERLIIEHK